MENNRSGACGDHWGTLLSKYADRELAGVDREEVERHLAGCETCRRGLVRYEIISKSIGLDPTLSVDRRERVIGKLLGRIGYDRSETSIWSRWVEQVQSVFSAHVLAGAMAAAASIFFALWIQERSHLKELDRRMAAVPVTAISMNSTDRRLLSNMRVAYSGDIDWLTLSGDQIQVGLPEKSFPPDEFVAGREDYVPLSIGVASEHPIRILARDGAVIKLVLPVDDRIRVAIRCSLSITAAGAALLDGTFTVFGRGMDAGRKSEISCAAELKPGNRIKLGEVSFEGRIIAIHVTAGERISVSPEAQL